ncbi:HD domain-containing protein [Streptomyces sp. enrichment culture]|uniref:HD domain-containing protein n=1 Tax=Streptomyces sp. enrichment culture TaxID=1795815 RepID=UPI003F56723F
MNDVMINGVPPLPDTPLARRALALVRETESTATANHSVRSALFARLRADHEGAEPGRDYDPELLFLACVLHDIGLTQAGDRHQRFEVDGADTAAEFLTAQGLPTADVDAVWEAVALHTSPGIAERRGTLCALVHQGTGMDFGWNTDCVDDATAAAIHAAYPRLSMATTLTDEIVAQARRRPEKAPLFSLTAELLRERSAPPHRTRMETMADAARWGN